jgi:methylenetetrahydrofolate reductase (NADPH)
MTSLRGPVFDLDVLGLLHAVAALQSGTDLGGQSLHGTPTFCVGTVVNPGAPDRQKKLQRMEDKVARGAQFFQTQAVYDPVAFAQFIHEVRHHRVAVLASIIVLRSGGMARGL